MEKFLETAVGAARLAGEKLRANFGQAHSVDEETAYDIKLALDVECQEIITAHILKNHPDHNILGEEGSAGNAESPMRWIVDPIDGTVNYFYNIPHFCVSIAMQQDGVTEVGVIYDPMRDEMFTAVRGGPVELNGKPITVSQRKVIGTTVVSIGLSKLRAGIDGAVPLLQRLVHKVRKCRAMGSAALDLAYIAAGRLDVYIEKPVGLWDIAAGVLLVEMAGGKVTLESSEQNDKYGIVAGSGHIDFLAEAAKG